MGYTFCVRINGGEQQTITSHTGTYRMAAAAVPALLDLDGHDWPLEVEIWMPDLLPDYGPYCFLLTEDRFGNLVVKTLVRRVLLPDPSACG